MIANARNVQAGGEADPNAAAAGRKALLASRQNTIFSFPMLVFMVGAAHFFVGQVGYDTGDNRGIYWADHRSIIWLVLELNALGKISGTRQHRTQHDLRDHKNAIVHRLRARSSVVLTSSPRSSCRRLPATSAQTPSRSAMRARCVRLGAEQRLARLHAPHVEVHVVLPRVADAAVDLDALLARAAAGSRPPRPWRSTSRVVRRSSSSAIVSAAK